MRTEERVFVFPTGEEGQLSVSSVAPGRFRIEETVGLLNFPVEDLPDEIGLGWIIDADELDDGRLQVRGIVENPNVESVSGLLIPPGFADSPEFEALSDAIVTMDGNLEVFAQGLFSAYVPIDKAQDRGFSLMRDLKTTLDDWIKRAGNS